MEDGTNPLRSKECVPRGKERAALLWERLVNVRERAVARVKSLGFTPLELRYEDLVTDTGVTLREVLRFLELDEPPGYVDACSSIVVHPCPVVKGLRPGKWTQKVDLQWHGQ